VDRILLQQYITPVNTIGIDFIDYSYVKPREYLLAKINNVDSPTVPNLKQLVGPPLSNHMILCLSKQQMQIFRS